MAIRKITWVAKRPVFVGDEFKGFKKTEHSTRYRARISAGFYFLSQVHIKYTEAKVNS